MSFTTLCLISITANKDIPRHIPMSRVMVILLFSVVHYFSVLLYRNLFNKSVYFVIKSQEWLILPRSTSHLLTVATVCIQSEQRHSPTSSGP